MATPPDRGFAIVIAVLTLLLVAAGWLAAQALAAGSGARRGQASDRALAQAREALLAHAADRPITAWVGPGYLPCPDLDDDGWAEPTCGSQSGDIGQDERIGRLPWKTLGLPDLRDGHGERLWYAVSSKHKGLLNCAVSRACLDMSPDAAIGTITVRDASGAVVHDGTSTDLYAVDGTGAVAVVIAPGPPLAGQRRECPEGHCAPSGQCLGEAPRAVPKCHPANYLDRAPPGAGPGEDNADFVDRNDAPGRARNTNGFIQGPVAARDGTIAVNDRVAAIAYRDLMPRVMRRVALEVAACLEFYASRPENAGRYPTPAPVCRQDAADPALAWADGRGLRFGRVPDTPFARTREASDGRMLERWWRHEARTPESLAELPTRGAACRIAFEPRDDGATRTLAAGTPAEEGRTAGLGENAWWTYWKPFVFYAIGPLDVVDPQGNVVSADKPFAVLVAGAPLRLPAIAQRHGSGLGDARQWLEAGNADLERANPNPAAPECPAHPFPQACTGRGCLRVTQGRGPQLNDVVAVPP